MTIQNALTNFFGNRYKTYKGDIGLEIETETEAPYDIPKFSFWNSHPDNSLRGFGMEYTLKQPLDFKITFPKALEEFNEKTKGVPFVKDSITTSVHVHLNFLNDNFVTLGNFLTLYSLTENLLIRASGEDRLSNLFCLPICDAEEIHHNMVRMFRGIKDKKYASMNFEAENTKYGAINLSSLVNFGSLEIRSFRGTTDIKTISDWVGTLHTMQSYARTPNLVPPQIILGFKEKRTEYLTDVFGEYRKFIRHQDEEALIEKNFWYAAALAYEVKDWSKLEEIVKPKKVKSKDLDKVSMTLYGRNFEALGDTGLQQTVIRQAELINEREALGPEMHEYENPLNGRLEMMTDDEYVEADARARREGIGIYAPRNVQAAPYRLGGAATDEGTRLTVTATRQFLEGLRTRDIPIAPATPTTEQTAPAFTETWDDPEDEWTPELDEDDEEEEN